MSYTRGPTRAESFKPVNGNEYAARANLSSYCNATRLDVSSSKERVKRLDLSLRSGLRPVPCEQYRQKCGLLWLMQYGSTYQMSWGRHIICR